MAVSPRPTRITSGYGVRIGRTGRPTFHAGLDFLGARGEPVVAVAAGVVAVVASDETRGPTSGYGNAIAIDHGDGWWTLYAHLDTVNVTPGQAVAAGERIGTVGNTSNGKFPGMGAHLHFEVRSSRNGSPFPGPYRRHNVDPRPWLEQRGVTYDRRGHLVDEVAQSGLSGPVDELDFDAEGLPDEPGILDPWAYDAAPAWLLGVGVAFGAASVAAGAWTFWQSWKASR